MVRIKSGDVIYDYPDKVIDTFIIDKNVKNDFSKFLAKHRMKKSTMVEELYKEILLLERLGRLKDNNYIMTIDLKSLGRRCFRR